MAFDDSPAAVWNGGDYGCFARPTTNVFSRSDTMLQSCSCSDGTCTTIATLPEIPSGYNVSLSMDPGRRVVMVGYRWPGQIPIAPNPDILCYSASGQLLASIPHGAVELDRTGQIALLYSSSGSTNAGQYAIVDLASGQTHWLGTVAAATFVYE